MTIKISAFPVGFLGTNCYFVINSETSQCLIVDPGGDPQHLLNKLNDLHLEPRAILLTHAHVDHINAIPELKKQFPDLPVMMHEHDLPLYHSKDNSILPWIPATQNLPDTQPFSDIEGFDITLIHTPGHTQGGVCYYLPSISSLISGDTLFDGDIGRTDLPGGNYRQLVSSITEKLFTLPEETIVYPGHGSSSTIKRCQYSIGF